MTEALKLYMSEIKITAKCFKYFGFDVFKEGEFKFNFMSIVVLMDCVMYHLTQIYSVYYYRNNSLELFFCLITWAYGLQSIFVIWSFYSNRRVLWPLHLSLIEFHKKYEERSILLEYNKKFKKLIDLITKVILTNFLLCFVYPMIVVIFSNERVLTFGFIIAFIDPKSNIGYSINYTYQCLQIILFGLGYATYLRIFWQLFGNVFVRIDMLKEVVKELKEYVERDYADNDVEQRKLTLKLDGIVDLHLEFLSSIDSLETIGNKIVFIIAVTTVIQVSIVLLVLFKEFWYPGITIVSMVTAILLAVCSLGTILEVKREEFSAALYDVPWYLMPVKHQKKFLYILLASQMNKPITFWDYAEVTVESFLDIYSKIYTGFMLLFNTN